MMALCDKLFEFFILYDVTVCVVLLWVSGSLSAILLQGDLCLDTALESGDHTVW